MRNFPNKHIDKKSKALDAAQVKEKWDIVLNGMNKQDSNERILAGLWDIYIDALHTKGLITDLQAVSITNPYSQGLTILAVMT